MRAASSIGALAWAAAVLLLTATSAGQPADGSAGPDPQGQPGNRSRPVVAVSVAGDEAAAQALERALAELLGRLNASLSLRRVEGLNQAPERPPEQAAAWVGIDVSHPDRAVVTVVDRAAGAATVWRVLERRTSRQILLDEAAHVVHAAVESLLSGRRADGEQAGTPAPPDDGFAPPAATGPPAVPAPASPAQAPGTAHLPPAPVAGPPPLERPLWGLDAAALLAGHGMADNAGLVFGAAGALSAGYRQGPWRFGGWLTAEYRVPFDVDDSETSPRAQAVALRTFPTMGLLQSPALSLDLGVGGGMDIFTVDYRLANPQGSGTRQTSTKVAPIFTSMLVLHVAVVDNVQLAALAGIDVDPSRPGLEVRRELPEEARPWVVRPSLMIGASFTLFGTEPFE